MSTNTLDYHDAMGKLLVLYTQVDRLIMEICAERIAVAPDEHARLGLAKQVGDESNHVAIQKRWMEKFGVDQTPVITETQEAAVRDHFRSLSWMDFLADMYLCVEALGSEAVEKVVPLADPGTRESLRIPLSDEINHVAFGVKHLRQELTKLSDEERDGFLHRIPARIDALTRAFHGFDLNLKELFEAVGANYDEIRAAIHERRTVILREVDLGVAA
jgi:hypothetical protein